MKKNLLLLSLALILASCSSGSSSGPVAPPDDQPDAKFEMESTKNPTACSNKHRPVGKKITASQISELDIPGLILEEAQIYIEYRRGGGEVISSMLGTLHFAGDGALTQTTSCLDTRKTADTVKYAILPPFPHKMEFKEGLIRGMVEIKVPLIGSNAVSSEATQHQIDPNLYSLESWADVMSKASEFYRKGDSFQVMFNMRGDNGDGTNWFRFLLLRYKLYTPPAE